MIYGPPILNDSPFLLDEVNEYNKGEFGKKYDYRNYQDKRLSKNKELNISPQSYVKKKNPKTIDINEYLRNIRKGVDR
ncbi:DNA replication protein [Fusobacterium sp.]|jgi:DNA replication priming helicase|uniref:DNA replication protein n=1 Tax=Fusobacterium sp. TaxID=68766 RepID=UPI002A838030|nr:DNA replication protein [Fusobacterium sp.]